MKTTDDLVTAVRGDSRNEGVPSSLSRIGILTSDVVRYLNYGQQRLQNLILKGNPGAFRFDQIFPIVANQEQYSVTDRVFAGERIISVQYSADGSLRLYRNLPEKGLNYRNTQSLSRPSFYVRRSSAILLNPIPSSAVGSIRVTYERQLDDLNIKNGTVSSASGSSIVLSSPTAEQEALFVTNAFICISDLDGNVHLRNGRIQSYNAGSDTITLAASVGSYLTAGSTLASLAGAFVTMGKYTTNLCQLPDFCERYIELYAGYKMFKRDTSSDAADNNQELKEVEAEIVQAYQDAYRDEINVQLSNPDLVLDGDWGEVW